jgi:hypothetical protein
MTQFLSLDKCLPRRQYLSIVHLPVAERQVNAKLQYDLEWLAVVCKTHELTQTHDGTVTLPSRIDPVTLDDVEGVRNRLAVGKPGADGELSLVIPSNFVVTVAPHEGPASTLTHQLPPPLPRMGNPQTDQFLAKLGLHHIGTIPHSPSVDSALTPPSHGIARIDENEIDLESDVEAGSADEVLVASTLDEAVNYGALAEVAVESSAETTSKFTKKPRVDS